MSMYQCEVCSQIIDGDTNPCVEHPTNPTAYCCEACADSIEMEKEYSSMRSANQREVEGGLK